MFQHKTSTLAVMETSILTSTNTSLTTAVVIRSSTFGVFTDDDTTSFTKKTMTGGKRN